MDRRLRNLDILMSGDAKRPGDRRIDLNRLFCINTGKRD
jgi:hypothetical protein